MRILWWLLLLTVLDDFRRKSMMKCHRNKKKGFWVDILVSKQYADCFKGFFTGRWIADSPPPSTFEHQSQKTYLLKCAPKKTQIRLRTRAVRLYIESPLSAWRNFASLAIQNAPSEDSDQTVRMCRLIWIFAGRTCPNVYVSLTPRIIWN